MIITVVGGTGFVGSGILLELSQFDDFELFSISRSGAPINHDALADVHWVKGDVTQPGDWQAAIAKSDWVIDCVGILFPNPLAKTSYWQNSILPAESLINLIHRQNLVPNHSTDTRFLFISANYAPFFMAAYIRAKLEVEKDMANLLPDKSIAIYPGVITDKHKPLTRLLRGLTQAATLSTYFKRLRFIPRETVAQEVVKVLVGEGSSLTERIGE